LDFVTGGKGKLKIVASDDATLHAREELGTVGTCGRLDHEAGGDIMVQVCRHRDTNYRCPIASRCVEIVLERAWRRKVLCGGHSTYLEYYVVVRRDLKHGEWRRKFCPIISILLLCSLGPAYTN